MRQRKPIPFSWRLEKEWCKNGDWDVWHGVFGLDSVEREIGKIVNNHKNSRENTEKVLKTLFKMQNTHFSRLKWVANKSPGLAAKILKDKIVKNFLSIFRDWKVYPWAELRKSLCTPREQVTKINTRSHGWSTRLRWPAIESSKQGNTVFEIFQFL